MHVGFHPIEKPKTYMSMGFHPSVVLVIDDDEIRDETFYYANYPEIFNGRFGADFRLPIESMVNPTYEIYRNYLNRQIVVVKQCI